MIKNLISYIYYNISLGVSKIGDQLRELVPPITSKPIEPDDDPYDIEDSIYEPDDEPVTKSTWKIGRNDWGLPIVEEEE